MRHIRPFIFFSKQPLPKLLWSLVILFSLPTYHFGQAEVGKAVESEFISPRSASIPFIKIEKIQVTGNHRTKTDVILRELDFTEGDSFSISTITNRLEKNEFKLLNTGLFTFARFNFIQWDASTNNVILRITVTEGWYIYPFPILEIADRNFNVWWETYNASLQRLNMGVRFYHTNATGRKDKLKMVYQFGFTRKYELEYSLPYFNKYRSIGLSMNLLNTHEKEIGYTTQNNELLYNIDADKTLLKRFRAGLGVQWRRGLDLYHRWNISYYHNIVHSTVLQDLNPDYFLHGRNQRYFSLFYEFNYDKRDRKPYPMKGFQIIAQGTKNGFGITEDANALEVSGAFNQYFTISNNWSLELKTKAKTNLIREKQPYYNSAALGYLLDYIRGYELYVVDGMDYAYLKSGLRFQLLNKSLFLGKYMIVPGLKEMPVRLYITARNELGYVNNPYYKTGNSLSNELLWGTSIGLDVIVYYNKVFNFEMSRNKLNEYGFFIHWNFSF
jgi:hypothetical protein